MSYARFWWDGSDVYVFGVDGGEIECCCCALTPSDRPENLMGYESHREPNAAAMVEHLEKHRAAGHTVPEYAFDELRAKCVSSHQEEGGA